MSDVMGHCGRTFRDGFCPEAGGDDLCVGCDYDWDEEDQEEDSEIGMNEP